MSSPTTTRTYGVDVNGDYIRAIWQAHAGTWLSPATGITSPDPKRALQAELDRYLLACGSPEADRADDVQMWLGDAGYRE